MRRAYYSSSIADFLNARPNEIIGELTRAHSHNLDQTQLNAWLEQITILNRVLTNCARRIYFEYAIPRIGKRIDVVLLIGPVIFVLEFRVEDHKITAPLKSLDWMNFHDEFGPLGVPSSSRRRRRTFYGSPEGPFHRPGQ
jgi:hypothetical protein